MKLKDLAFFKKKNVYGKSSKAPAKNEKRDNVRNQREHLVCLLADNHIRLTPRPEFLNKLDDRAVDAVKTKFFKNYKNWCKFLGRKHSLRLSQGAEDIQQQKILYMGF
ncbi:callose synthase 5-like [Brassica napus]|uniref:callose synthase 5-like n=1 Tax=Brassica napus TaxID=3708 RepID=UPI002078DB1E|nr:callose synthase 5-like [Brassica napus]